MSPEEIINNIMEGVSEIAKIIPRGWTNIQSLNIKSSSSIALPIHTSLPDNIEAIAIEPQTKKRKADEENNIKSAKKKKRKKHEIENDEASGEE